MNTHDKQKLIETAFQRLLVLEHLSFTPLRTRLYEQCLAEEKQHRGPGFRDAHTAKTASPAVCAKLFAVKRVAEYLGGLRMPRGKDFIHYQISCFWAAGCVDKYRREIRKAWRGLDVAALSNLDYTEFVVTLSAGRRATRPNLNAFLSDAIGNTDALNEGGAS